MGKRILIIGSLNMDMVIEVNAMPKVGETVMARKLTYVPGGKGANQTYTSGRLGGNVTMLGCVGNDSFGAVLLDSICGSGADVSFVKKSEDRPTGTAVIYVNGEGDNSIVVVSGANHACDVEYLKENDDLFVKSDFVMLQMEIPYEAVFYAIRRAKELGKTVILNPAPSPAPEEIPEDIWAKIDYFTPNETELLKLSHQEVMTMQNVRRGVDSLLNRGVKRVVVTLGECGAYYSDGTEYQIFPARKVSAVDTTAAGDCFSGAFVTALAEGRSIREAVTIANISSSLAVTRKGAQSSIPTREEVKAVLASEGY